MAGREQQGPARSTSAASNPPRQQPRQQAQPSAPTHQQQAQPPQQSGQQGTAIIPPVRRTLFSSSLLRRPAAPSSSSTTAAPPDAPRRNPRNALVAEEHEDEESDDEQHEEYAMEQDGVAFGQDDEGDDGEDGGILVPSGEVEDIFAERSRWSGVDTDALLMACLQEDTAAADALGGAEDEGNVEGRTGLKSESARLIELYRSHARQRIDPNEIKPAIQESLRRKVAALDDDKWMYEVESDSEES